MKKGLKCNELENDILTLEQKNPKTIEDVIRFMGREALSLKDELNQMEEELNQIQEWLECVKHPWRYYSKRFYHNVIRTKLKNK